MCPMRHLTPTDEKRLAKYPEHVRKIKRLRQQIRDLNRCIRKLKASSVDRTFDELREFLEQAEQRLFAEIAEQSPLTFPRPRGTFRS